MSANKRTRKPHSQPHSQSDELTQTRTVSRSPGSLQINVNPIAIKKKSKGSFLVFFIFASLLLLGSFFVENQSPKNKSRPVSTAKVEALVNKHLLLTNKKIELQEETVRLEQSQAMPEVGMSILPRTRHGALYGIETNSDRNEKNAIRDLERQKEIDVNSPDAIIQAEFADRQRQALTEARYREEYARQFIANARAAGYLIELDENFVVKSVKRLKPEEQNLFERFPSAAH